MIDGIVFDKDGTLFDFRAAWTPWARQVVDELSTGPGHARALGRALGFDPATGRFARDSLVIAATVGDSARALLPLLPGWTETALTDRLNALSMAVPLAEVVPLRAFLTGLRNRGLRLGLATNDAEAPARAHLAACGIEDRFDFVAGSDSGHGGKPGPGMLLAFLCATGLPPERAVMVGDSLHDLAAARAAGMRRVAVLTGIAGPAELAPHAEAVLGDIGALPAWIDGLSAAP